MDAITRISSTGVEIRGTTKAESIARLRAKAALALDCREDEIEAILDDSRRTNWSPVV